MHRSTGAVHPLGRSAHSLPKLRKDPIMANNDDDRPCPCGRSHTVAEHSYDPEREAAQAHAEDIANGLVEDDEPDRSVVVQMHSDMGREPHPAVNIKVNKGPESVPLPLELGGVADVLPDGTTSPVRAVTTDPRFTLEWIEAHLNQSQRDGWWEQTCEDHFQQARELAQETFGAHVKVWQEGRSGGWLIVEGLGDVEEWTRDEVTTWAAFAEQVRAIADSVPYGYLWNLNANVFELWLEEQDESAEGPDIEEWFVPRAGDEDEEYPEYVGNVLHEGCAYTPDQVEEFARKLLELAQEARRQGPQAEMPEVPEDFPVRPLGPDEHPAGRTTCGTCGRSWDDDVSTQWTPAPGGRCPFEYFHPEEL